MDFYKNGIICTKHRLWKSKRTVISIVDELITIGYTFIEMVYGEPNDFVFANTYEDIDKQLSRKGFFGIRLKLEKPGVLLTIESNTNGIDNVKYSIFSETEDLLDKTILDALNLKSTIKPSNSLYAKTLEYLSNNPKVRSIIFAIFIVLGVVAVNNIFPIISMALSIFMFAPFIFIYIAYSYLRRR